MDHLAWLQCWYEEQCGGEWGAKSQWDYDSGISINSKGIEGWFVKISIKGGVPLAGTANTNIQVESGKNVRNETGSKRRSDWLRCRIENGLFEGDCGPANLSEVIQTFREWVDPQGLIYVPEPMKFD